MNKVVFERAFMSAVSNLRQLAPKDTGNLAYNAIKYKWLDGNTFYIYVDEGSGIDNKMMGVAPYMPFTNEVWGNSKRNPNQGWWNEAITFIIGDIARSLGGELE